MLTKQDVAGLLQLAKWLELQPCRSASSGDIANQFPHLRNWTTSAWLAKRNLAKVIYYQVGYGWRLHRNYKSRLAKLSDEINRRAMAAPAVRKGIAANT